MDAETLQGLALAALHTPAVRGALHGVFVAAGVDFAMFRSCKSFDEFARYQWGVATWRWFQGAVIGAVDALIIPGFGA